MEMIAIGVGGMSIGFRTESPVFAEMLRQRYAGFLDPEHAAEFQFSVDLVAHSGLDSDEDIEVRHQEGIWSIQRGDFRAEWDVAIREGRIRQAGYPYATDTLLRIVHTLLLTENGGFLLHGASAVRNGKAFLFSGVSGAGKTTISRLAPPDAVLLTDEISYLRSTETGYRAFGTPFAGELAKSGDNISAPVEALYFLAKGPFNRIDPIPMAEASRRLLRNILFFAEDAKLMQQVFEAACQFVTRVPAFELTFVPNQTVWEMIR
jgi:hypothetical protein